MSTKNVNFDAARLVGVLLHFGGSHYVAII
jgi:hypothetical protein